MDLRPTLDAPFSVFGVAAVVTPPDETAIETTVVWVPAFTEGAPAGGSFQRREPQKVLALRRDEVPVVPRGTVILAPELGGGTILGWRVDALEQADAETHRVIVVRDPNLDP